MCIRSVTNIHHYQIMYGIRYTYNNGELLNEYEEMRNTVCMSFVRFCHLHVYIFGQSVCTLRALFPASHTQMSLWGV